MVDIDSNSTDELGGTTEHLDLTGGFDYTLNGTVQVNVVTSLSSSGYSVIEYGQSDASGLTVSDTATTDYSLDIKRSTTLSIWNGL